MNKSSALTKTLTIAGTVFIWLPLFAPVVFSIFAYFERGRFLFDYLMPAELFLIAFTGGGLLFWSAWRAQFYRKLIGWSIGGAVFMLVVSQAIAVIGQPIYGENEPPLVLMILMISMLILYTLGLLGTGIGAILLLRKLFKTQSHP